MSSSRGMSAERRNLAARLMRDGFFLGPLKSLVGAVVMISGAGSTSANYIYQRKEGWLRRGSGGGFSACCFTRRDSWESEALRKRRTEKRWCLLFSS